MAQPLEFYGPTTDSEWFEDHEQDCSQSKEHLIGKINNNFDNNEVDKLTFFWMCYMEMPFESIEAVFKMKLHTTGSACATGHVALIFGRIKMFKFLHKLGAFTVDDEFVGTIARSETITIEQKLELLEENLIEIKSITRLMSFPYSELESVWNYLNESSKIKKLTNDEYIFRYLITDRKINHVQFLLEKGYQLNPESYNNNIFYFKTKKQDEIDMYNHLIQLIEQYQSEIFNKITMPVISSFHNTDILDLINKLLIHGVKPYMDMGSDILNSIPNIYTKETEPVILDCVNNIFQKGLLANYSDLELPMCTIMKKLGDDGVDIIKIIIDNGFKPVQSDETLILEYLIFGPNPPDDATNEKIKTLRNLRDNHHSFDKICEILKIIFDKYYKDENVMEYINCANRCIELKNNDNFRFGSKLVKWIAEYSQYDQEPDYY